MKRHIIPIIVVILLLMICVVIASTTKLCTDEVNGSMPFAERYNTSTAIMYELMLIIYSFVPCIYGLAVTLLVLLQFKKNKVPKVYSVVMVIVFALAAIGMVIALICYYGLSWKQIESWMVASWSVTGLLFPFFVFGIVNLKKRNASTQDLQSEEGEKPENNNR